MRLQGKQRGGREKEREGERGSERGRERAPVTYQLRGSTLRCLKMLFGLLSSLLSFK